MDEQQQSTAAPKNSMGPIIAIVGIIVIVVVGVIAYQSMNKPQTQNTTTEAMQQQQTQAAQPTQETAAQPSGEVMSASNYKDGEYTAVGHYTSPGGAEELGVTLTLKDGVVTDSTVEVKATRPMSKTKQTEFSQNYKPQVVGKSIDEINLVKVAGSSLSPKGFNDAVEQIKAEAKA